MIRIAYIKGHEQETPAPKLTEKGLIAQMAVEDLPKVRHLDWLKAKEKYAGLAATLEQKQGILAEKQRLLKLK